MTDNGSTDGSMDYEDLARRERRQDALAALIDSPLRAEPASPPASYQRPTFTGRCRRCGGSGRYGNYGQCFKCRGSGTETFATSPETRANALTARRTRAARSAAENLEAFKAANPEVWTWIDGNSFGFAVAMRAAIERYGDLTPNQLAACQRCIAKREAARAADESRVANAQPVSMTALDAAFARAGNVLKRPKLRVEGMVIYPAPATGRNAGALYVRTDDRVYLGKIAGGRFVRSRECTDAQEAALLAVAADPIEAAVRYGRLTGNCACCGAALTAAESVARGIGPICAERFGF